MILNKLSQEAAWNWLELSNANRAPRVWGMTFANHAIFSGGKPLRWGKAKLRKLSGRNLFV